MARLHRLEEALELSNRVDQITRDFVVKVLSVKDILVTEDEWVNILEIADETYAQLTQIYCSTDDLYSHLVSFTSDNGIIFLSMPHSLNTVGFLYVGLFGELLSLHTHWGGSMLTKEYVEKYNKTTEKFQDHRQAFIEKLTCTSSHVILPNMSDCTRLDPEGALTSAIARVAETYKNNLA